MCTKSIVCPRPYLKMFQAPSTVTVEEGIFTVTSTVAASKGSAKSSGSSSSAGPTTVVPSPRYFFEILFFSSLLKYKYITKELQF